MYLNYLAQLEEAEKRYKDKCRQRDTIHDECEELHKEIVRIYTLMAQEVRKSPNQ